MDSDPHVFGRHIERHVIRERVFDETSGTEFANERAIETSESCDDSIETLHNSDVRILACGHPHELVRSAAPRRHSYCIRLDLCAFCARQRSIHTGRADARIPAVVPVCGGGVGCNHPVC